MEKSSKKGSPSPSSSPVLAPRQDLSGLDKIVEAECTQTFARKFERLPIHKDLGRLVSKIKLIDSNGEELFVGQPSSDEPLGVGVKRFLKTLVNIFDPDVATNFMEKLEKEIKDEETRNLIGCLQNFFPLVDDLEDVKLRTLRLLKAVNQSIVAPGVVNLQLATQGKYALSDVGWTVLIRLFESHVVVDHNRVESVTVSQQSSAMMFWRERFLLKSKDMSLVKVQLRVVELDTNPDDPATEAFLKFVNPIYEPSVLQQVRLIFGREWSKLPIAKDVCRFAASAVLQDGDSQSAAVVIRNLEQDQLKQVKVLLIQLSKMFNPSIEQMFRKQFDGAMGKAGSDITLMLRSFLTDIVQLGGSDPFCRVLKFFTQSIVGPVAIAIQMALATLRPIKDGGEWRVSLIRTAKSIEITHTKSETSIERADPENLFDFSWSVTFSLNLFATKIRQVTVALDSIRFPLGDKTSNEAKSEITSLIKSCIQTIN